MITSPETYMGRQSEGKWERKKQAWYRNVGPAEAKGPKRHECSAGICHLCESGTFTFYKIIPAAQGSSRFHAMENKFPNGVSTKQDWT